MDQLPNLNVKYKIIEFDPAIGRIVVFYLNKYYEQWIDVPIVNNQYITGVELDNLIMSFYPLDTPVKVIDKKPSNEDYIQSLVTNKFNIPTKTLVNRTEILTRRHQALRDSDWTQLPDAQEVLTESERMYWRRFRQELRDITKQPGYPDNVVWPQRPYIMGTIIL
jgi:hypothetical protein